ncbi:B12-binding domain-containing radical SAM protein [Candidatus Geothermarchaeota archaeon ex4572_27]|nr:MAG: B12-binding domain-containing radical SAM protein [Candidatus Geothermarchaeota archaeon ex4572_27]
MSGTRVLLAVPPEVEHLEIYRVSGIRAPPLGLAWIAAVLEEAGHKVAILDSPTLSLTRDGFVRYVKRFKPDLVGLTAITPTVYKAYAAADMIKEVYPDVPVIVGGPHTTFMYEEALSRPSIDVVVRGEGEYTTLELVNVIEREGMKPEALRRVRGIAFRDEGGVRVNEPRPPIHNLDALPKPARHLLPMDKYTFLDKPVRIFHLMASRGCPYGCIYCSSSYFWGRRVRLRSVESVIDEIKDAIYKYKTNTIVFADDELTISRRWILEFARRVKEEKLDIYYTAGSRVDRGSLEILKALKDSGCGIVYYGVESANQESLNRIGKGITISMIKRAFENARKVGIEVAGSFILGFPWETISDMMDTIKFAIKLNPTVAQFTVLTPYPGTPIYYQAIKENLIEDFNWEHYTTLKAVMRGYHFTRSMLQKMLSLAYRKFYVRLAYFVDLLRKHRLSMMISIIKKEVLPWLLSPLRRIV